MLGTAMHPQSNHPLPEPDPQAPYGASAYGDADELVSGEAVALDLPAAGIGVRAVSGLLDVLAVVVVFVGVTFVYSLAAARAGEALLHVAVIGAAITAFLVVPTTVETWTRGRSVGKWAMGLRVVRDDGGTITAQHAFTRALIGVVEIYVLSATPAVFSILLNRRGKRLGDLAAGTYVVRERSALRLPSPRPMPPELAAWAQAADIAPLPRPLALGVRQFLGRTGDLTPEARAAVGTDLAAQVFEHVSPPPPPGTPAEAFLAAVTAARRERDLTRMQREQALRERLSAAGTPGR